MKRNKNNKARCKKLLLVVKMTISICVNRKLLRMKSTIKQESNQTLKITVFSHLYLQAQGLSLRVCSSQRRNEGGQRDHNAPGAVHWRAPISLNNITSTFFSTVHLLRKTLGSNVRAPDLLLCPGRHLTSVRPWKQ